LACSRGQVDQPVMIRVLKRFISDYAEKSGGLTVTPVEKTKQERIAIVGSGPAGLTAAHDLALKGYPVTVFESLPVAGGTLAVGIPDYHLPKEALRRDIDAILALGIELKLNTPVKKLDDLFDQGYKAIFVAVGTQVSGRLNIAGEDGPGVFHALEFLKAVNLGEKVAVGERVVVVGGGNVAIDAARAALRLKAKKVELVCLESRPEMPAFESGIRAAAEEGIGLNCSWGVKRLMGEGKLTGIETMRCTSVFDDQKRFRPTFDESITTLFPADTVILAIGQVAKVPEDFQLHSGRGGTIPVDPVTLSTERPGVFAGGDVTTGPLDVVHAVGAGHRAALSIDRYVRGEDLKAEGVAPLPVVKFTQEELDGRVEQGEITLRPQPEEPTLPMAERKTTFEEVDLGLSEEDAVAEAKRCLSCGLCSECKLCVSACLRGAVLHEERDREEKLQVGAVLLAPGFSLYDARLSQEFGFGRYPNVVTSLQFERLLSASGPTQGHVHRPSDSAPPKKVAFLQCVGSRDQKHPYCSSVCCMYATK
ncbi:MAG: FAD-dependent oxidoreductase, partial [Chloroflexota bacterium]|nr:FAD-dependent oxidoreductase [Chloroflexota bacterium]